MKELAPVAPAMLAHYQRNIDEYTKIARGLNIPSFTGVLRRELGLLGLADDAIRLLEAVTRIWNCSDSNDLAKQRKEVSRLLKSRGVSLSRGKRTDPGLQELVARLTPLMLHFGVPLATSVRSRLVRGLQVIAEEIGVKGDPRDELRRLKRLERVNESIQKQAVRDLAKAWAEALRPDE